MSTFEQTLAAELRAEADRASSATDTTAMRTDLRRRLDDAGSAAVRRRWTYVVASVAAAALVVGVAVVVSGRDTAEVPPARPTPPPGPVVAADAWKGGTELLAQPQLNLPTWASGITPVVAPRRLVSWRQAECGQNPCAPGEDRSLTLFLPYTDWLVTTEMANRVVTWDATPDFLDLLRARDGVTMSTFTQEATLNAGAANVAVVSTTQDVPGGLGCPQLDSAVADCQGLVRGTRNVLAVLNAGGAPLLVMSTALDTTDAAAQDEEMRQVLATLRLTGIPVSCTALLGPDAVTQQCLPDLWRRVERDASLQVGGGQVTQAAFDAAYQPYDEQLADPVRGLPVAWSYERGPGLTDDGASTKDTTATWTIDGTATKANICFVGTSLLIGTEPCP